MRAEISDPFSVVSLLQNNTHSYVILDSNI